MRIRRGRLTVSGAGCPARAGGRPRSRPRSRPRPGRPPGTAAAEAGHRVRYVTTAALVNELVEAADDKQLSRVVGRYARIDLLCLDEIGYVHLDPRGAELLFRIITEREEKASIACAFNAPFSEWSQTFTDPRLAAAIVDRLTFRGHVIATGTDSYRLRATRAAKTGVATN
ncbi:ATP-binding protein [Modestobacter muralis]|uniref:ATP-binding protein n=1 Tax=Modestobacter muralis TaxID=1608614 RepID=UPI0030B88404